MSRVTKKLLFHIFNFDNPRNGRDFLFRAGDICGEHSRRNAAREEIS
jgi:hypothetical protein